MLTPDVTPPLKLGPLVVDPPVVLAPMAGVTSAPFRQLCRGYGAGLYVSEMVTARALVERHPRSARMVARAEGEDTHSVQLYGVDPAVVGRAVRQLVEEVGVDHVDLNFGCPAAKVTRKGGGAALPVHRTLLSLVVRAAVAAAGSVPVTVKMRLGTDDEHLTFLEAGRRAADEGAAAVALHARTAEQLYSGTARWEAIGELKQAVTSVPVLGNGDIWEAADALAMVEATGCDGVVVGRGCLGRPWLFGELADAFAGRPVGRLPRLGTVVEGLRTHARLLCEEQGEDGGCRDLRKHTGWYLTGFPVGGERRRRLAMVSTLAELDDLLGEVIEAVGADTPCPEEARRVARGHTQGPRPVALPRGWFDDVDDPRPPQGADALVSGG